jgi:hypothetical protein
MRSHVLEREKNIINLISKLIANRENNLIVDKIKWE